MNFLIDHNLERYAVILLGKILSYQITASVVPNQTAIATEIHRADILILATNVLDAAALSDDDILREYKAQQSTERGFRFLKDPLFFTKACLPQLYPACRSPCHGYGFVPTCL